MRARTGVLAAPRDFLGRGPLSGKNWWSGFYGVNETLTVNMEDLRTPADLITFFTKKCTASSAGLWSQMSGVEQAQTIIDRVKLGSACAHIRFRLFPRGGVRPSAWPSDPTGITDNMMISPINGPGASATQATGIEVWNRAAQGWFDTKWTTIVQAARNVFGTKDWARTKRWIVAPAWEMNFNYPAYLGTNEEIPSHCCTMCDTEETAAYVKAALTRFNAICREEFGPRTLCFFNPLREADKFPVDMINYIPDDADIIGPDYYARLGMFAVDPGNGNFWTPRMTSPSDWSQSWCGNAGSDAVPKGLIRWENYVTNLRAQGRRVRLGVGEWGIVRPSEAKPDGSGDDANYIEGMFNHLTSMAAVGKLAFECYFNAQGPGGAAEASHWIGPVGSSTPNVNASAKYAELW